MRFCGCSETKAVSPGAWWPMVAIPPPRPEQSLQCDFLVQQSRKRQPARLPPWRLPACLPQTRKQNWTLRKKGNLVHNDNEPSKTAMQLEGIWGILVEAISWFPAVSINNWWINHVSDPQILLLPKPNANGPTPTVQRRPWPWVFRNVYLVS